MAKSQIIKELVNEDIGLSIALKRLIVLANDIGCDDLKQWAEKELNGYTLDDDLPEYRYITSLSFIYSGIVGGTTSVNHASLDLELLSKKTLEDTIRSRVNESISSIEKNAKLSEGELAVDRSYLAQEIFKNSGGYCGVQCTQIIQKFTPSQFEKIIQIVTSKVLNILLKLDKEFGNLDELDIGSNKISKEKFDEVKQYIFIVLNENKSLTMNGKTKLIKSQLNTGDNSKITNKREKKNIKSSNIGKGSNNIEKHTDVETNVTVNSEKKEKSSFLNKIFKKRSK